MSFILESCDTVDQVRQAIYEVWEGVDRSIQTGISPDAYVQMFATLVALSRHNEKEYTTVSEINGYFDVDDDIVVSVLNWFTTDSMPLLQRRLGVPEEGEDDLKVLDDTDRHMNFFNENGYLEDPVNDKVYSGDEVIVLFQFQSPLYELAEG